MWQRIQTVFLGLVILSLGISLIQPIWLSDKDALTPFYLKQSDSFLYMPYALTAVLGIASITLALLTIRRFDNRLVQIKLGALNSVMLAGMMICAVWFASKVADGYSGNFRYGWGLYLIFVAVICNWLAMRFIRRDERLVRDSDRIR